MIRSGACSVNKRKKVSIFYFLEQSVKGLWRNGVMTFASVAVLMSCLVVLGTFVLLLYNVNYNINNIGMLNYILVFVDTSLDPSVSNAELSTVAVTGDQAQTQAETQSQDGTQAQGESSQGQAQGASSGSSSSAEIVAGSASDNADGTDSSGTSPGLITVRGLWDGMSDSEIAELAAEYTSGDTDALLSEVEADIPDLRNFFDLSKARVEVDRIRSVLAAVKLRTGSLDGDTIGRYSTAEDSLSVEYRRITALADIEMQIQQLENVESVSFTSKAKALAEMNEKYSEYTDLFERLEDGDNPLTDQFTITYKENDDISELRYNLEHMTGLIYRVDCREDIAGTIENVRSGVVFIFVWFLVILLVVSMFVIINTIKLAVFSRRQEIAVMRYVGATNSFITMPFVFEGILIGLFSSIVAYIVEYYAYLYIHNAVIKNFGFISVIDFSTVNGLVLIGFIGIGVICGILGSVISLRKYLKA